MTDHLRENVLLRAGEVQRKLDDDGWLQFSKLCQLHRYELNEILKGSREVNPISFMRVAFALETVGVSTRLFELDADTRRIVMSLGSFEKGEIKDYFEKTWHRVHFTKYVCEGIPLTADMRQRIRAIAEHVRKDSKLPKKPKVNLDEVAYLKRMLAHGSAPPAPAMPAPPSPPPVAEKHSQTAVDSIITMVSCTANMADVSVKPHEVSDHDRVNLARVASRLFERFGVTRSVLEEYQAKRGDGGALTAVFDVFKTK